MIKLESVKQLDIKTGTAVESYSINIDTKAIQNGLVKELGTTPFSVLMAILSFLDDEGKAFPSQRKIAEITGLTQATVVKAIKKLLEVEIDGSPIISRELETLGNRKAFSVYSLVQKSKEPNQEKNSLYFVKLYAKLFEDTFGFKTSLMYARDNVLVKKKLMDNYSPEEVEMIITKGVTEYKQRWANEKYPYPSLGMVCGWIGNCLIQEQKQMEQEASERLQEQEKAKAQAVEIESRVNNLFDL